MAFQFPANPLIGDVFTPVSGTSYQWNGTGWVLFTDPMAAFPSGIVLPYAQPTVTILPFEGWLFCDGASYATALYPALFAIIGYAFGGSGANFNVPDLRGRVIAGLDDLGGTAAGRLTTAGSGFAGSTYGTGGGAENVALTAAQAPAHAHSISDPGHSHSASDPGHTHTDFGHVHSVNDPGHVHTQIGSLSTGEFGVGGSFGNMLAADTGASGTGITLASGSANLGNTATGITIPANTTGITTTASAGGGTAHANVQPTLVMGYIIKT